MAEVPNLPQDVLIEILFRLPAQSLCRFKSVSKQWRALISDPRLIATRNKKLILVSYDYTSPYSLYSVDYTNNMAATYISLKHPKDWTQILGSCNGLVLLCDTKGSLFLVNPSTRESRKLPLLPSSAIFSVNIMYGLGYDPSADEYKVVALCSYHCGSRFEYASEDEYCINIFTLKTNCWRRVQKPHCGKLWWANPKAGVFVEGSLHWLANSSNSTEAPHGSLVIVAFDLVQERLWYMPLPNSIEENPRSLPNLGVLGGCLSVIGCADFWVMREYGVMESWTKFSILAEGLVEPLDLCWNDGVVLLEENVDKLAFYNLKDGKLNYLTVRDIPRKFRAWTYVETFLSPHHKNLIEK